MKPLHILLLLCFCLGGYGQKHDYIWMTGANLSSGDTVDPKFSITQTDFNAQPPSIYRVYRPVNMQAAAASIADRYGVMQFYTNGFFVYSHNNQQMPNGDSLNPGKVADDYGPDYYPSSHGSMILPKPGTDSLYYIFHVGYKYGPAPFYAYCDKLYYTVVDMRLNNGTGDVIEKNKIVIEDSVIGGVVIIPFPGGLVGGTGMAGCKHANGRDWWIIIQELRTNCFYEYLLTPQGLDTIGKQCIGDTLHWDLERGSNLFSPDGSKYIWANPYENLNILDFDRCTGTLSDFVRIKAADSLGVILDGVAVSPNSRFLYLTTGTDVRQYDLEAPDIAQSEILIDNVWQGSPQNSTLYCQLAPDGKIYINTHVCDTFLHVVNNPDLIGSQCNFVRNQVTLPTYNCYYLPYYPNYRLGPLVGSICDSLPHNTGITERQETLPLHLYPNPATTEITITADETMLGSHLTITDITGRQVLAVPLSTANSTLSIRHLAAGIYHVLLKRGAQTVAVSKFAKQ